jgi:hypothetical protein
VRLGPARLVVPAHAALTAPCASCATQLGPLPDQSVRVEDLRSARVYLVHEGTLPESIRRMRIIDGARLIGYFGDAKWLCWERPPGRMILRAIAMKTMSDSPEVESRIAKQLEARDVVFVGMRVPAVQEHAELRLIPEEEGRALIADAAPPWVD